MSRLDGKTLGQLRKALLPYFRGVDEVRRAWTDADLDPARIHWQQSPELVLHATLEEANKVPARLLEFVAAIPDAVTDPQVEALLRPLRGLLPASPAVTPVRVTSEVQVKTLLIVSASPRDHDPLRVNAEVREIQDLHQKGKARDCFKVEHAIAATMESFKDALLRHKPTLLHFAGHCEGEDGLLLEDTEGNPAVLSPSVLAGQVRLALPKLEGIVLNGCETRQAAQALPPDLLWRIYTTRSIADDVALAFTRGFYRTLFHGRSIKKCFEHGDEEARVLHNNADSGYKFQEAAMGAAGNSAGSLSR